MEYGVHSNYIHMYARLLSTTLQNDYKLFKSIVMNVSLNMCFLFVFHIVYGSEKNVS